jgi:hypothetical protein
MNRLNFIRLISSFPKVLCVATFLSFGYEVSAQVPITNYTTDANGRVQLEINSTTNNYYILKIRNHLDSAFSIFASMTLGQPGTTIITESLESYPLGHYQVLEYSINSPFDTDADGIDDITEFNNMPLQNPLNPATSITKINGLVGIDQASTFHDLSLVENSFPWTPYLNGKEFVKFLIVDYDTPNPSVYFINSHTHNLHVDFASWHNVPHLGPGVKRGHVIFHPTVISNNGTLGTYAFNYSNDEYQDFQTTQRTHELLAANMPFLKNNLSYFLTESNEDDYALEILDFQNSRVNILFESDVYAGLNYWGLNQTEGYGFFRQVGPNDVPGPKDIVLYQTIPNTLPRVAGIMTSFIQTPLSHVNLRALQDNIPNAFIRDPLTIDTIADLLDHYIYYKVEQSNYKIREATVDEVNEWHEKNRPNEEQIPPLNLDYTSILPLGSITFDMYDGFGAKCVNVATMRTFGFPDKTIPDGFGIPFYYYQEFMKFNHFFDGVESMINNPDFQSDRDVRDSLLKEFREKIESAKMPSWMSNDMIEMQRAFPGLTSIRCRSSTNNEDLPGFSGAGLYDSKTHHPKEGHITRSVKQVYASLWNLRAFEERDYYRINHFKASMGVLCHPNYEGEKVNGVGVSADPIFHTEDTYYLNSQLESELITNPNGSKPEELLLHQNYSGNNGYSVIQHSSLVGKDTLLMTDEQIDSLKSFLTKIHNEFAKLYKAESNPSFAMDIEYKITSDNRLIIKQARPWVSYVGTDTKTEEISECPVLVFPNPAQNFVNVTCRQCNLSKIQLFDFTGNILQEKNVNGDNRFNWYFETQGLAEGIYFVRVYMDNQPCATKKVIKR